MAKFRDRVCVVCGDVKYNTATKADVCAACYNDAKKEIRRAEEKVFIEALGYLNVRGEAHSVHGAPRWTFTHADCDTEQTWTFGNIRKQVNADPTYVPCSHCGGKRRVKAAMAGYMEKHARQYDLSVYEDYCRKVRGISNKNFMDNQELLNPLGLQRSMTGYHLDHKVPIIKCFLEGIPPEVAGSVQNLQLLPAGENLTKCRSTYDNGELLNELKALAYTFLNSVL